MSEPTETLRVGDCRACRARVAGLHGAHDALTCVCTEPCEGCETSPAERPDLPAAIAGLRRDQPSCDSHEPSVDSTDAAPGGNGEDCLACAGVDLPYPWLCPGHDTPDAAVDANRTGDPLSTTTPDGLRTKLAEAEQDDLRAEDARRQTRVQRERAELAEAAIARVRRLCEMTIAHSIRVQAMHQARDTLAALDEPSGPAPAPATDTAAETPAYPWAQTIHTTDAGHTIRIPGTHHSPAGDETREVLVRREDVPVLRDMLDSALRDDETPDPAAWTPPPPGDTTEQLPDAILALIDPPDYLSTACQTADCLTAALAEHPEHADEIQRWVDYLQQKRCRLNHKYTGILCQAGHHQHNTEEQP